MRHYQRDNYRLKPWRLAAGFTLLEMMLTVALIGIASTFLVINLGNSDDRLLPLEARRFVALLNFAQDESILRGQPYLLKVNAAEKNYQLELYSDTSGFASSAAKKPSTSDSADPGSDEAVALGSDANADDEPLDRLSKPRKIPASISLAFSLQAVQKKSGGGSKFVPTRVHEILNESILDKASERFNDEEDRDENTIVIEPNGITSPFTLSMSVENKQIDIELDRFGRAAIVSGLQ